MRRLLAAVDGVREVVVLPETGSTNDDARARAARGAPEGTVVLADRQTAGRGRLGRTWHSPAERGVYLSVLLRPRRPPDEIPRWSLAASLAACEACRAASGLDVRIKWPNDLRIGRRKVAGVLAEARTVAGEAAELVLGIGINVSHLPEDFPPDLRDAATSLRAAGGAPADREALAAAVVSRLAAHHAALLRGVWNDVATAWCRLAEGAEGARVRVGAAGGSFEGLTAGLDAAGALLVRRDDGEIVAVRQAESVSPMEE